MPRRPAGRSAAALALLAMIPSVVPAMAAADGLAVGGLGANQPVTPIPAPPGQPAALEALGARLFADPRLSGRGRLSCASCHDLSTNGADGRAYDVGDDGTTTAFKTPTVFNAALSFRMNWRGDVRTLAEQASEALLNRHMMGGSPALAARTVAGDPALARLFRAAYNRRPDLAGVVDAIAAFEEILVTPDSRFDRFLRGDRSALSPQEQAGYALFKEIGCSACHQGVNVGGNLWERHGIFSALARPDPPVLRVPSLRNVAVTAPYFHDGSAATLPGAVSAMARAQLGRQLSPDETALIVDFLGTLTGRLNGRLVRPAG